ncbi:MAG TPA: permease prefix domain 1-containing protein [Pyrinomonadaceae bacterium]|nr:permease prefix domain 1-containing protein [Pyrinomonadaceae bacterium]
MKNEIADLFKNFNRKQLVFEVEDELRFHIEMLERKYAQDGMSAAAAKSAALRRFGSLERAMKQCVNIRSRNSLLRRVLKMSLILIGLIGLSLRMLGSDVNIHHIGDILIMIAISGRLLLYVRGLSPSNFLSGTNETCPSIVTETPRDGAKLRGA